MRGNADDLTKRQLLSSATTARARQLRRNASEPERRLWRALREVFLAAKFRRQVPIGPYYADFCSHAASLIVEVDGDTHASSSDRDAARTRFLNGEGYRVLRFTNADVMQNLDGVIAMIATAFPAPLVGEGGLAQRGRMRGSKAA